MAKIQKKYLIAGAIGVLSIAGAFAYLQYRKLMNYAIKIKNTKVRTLNKNLVSFDVFLLFTNNSDVKFDLKEQEYKVYVNDIYVTRASNGVTNMVKPNSTSEIGVNVAFDPNILFGLLKKGWLEMIANPNEVKIRVDIKLKVGLLFFTVALPTSVTFTLKELVALAKE